MQTPSVNEGALQCAPTLSEIAGGERGMHCPTVERVDSSSAQGKHGLPQLAQWGNNDSFALQYHAAWPAR